MRILLISGSVRQPSFTRTLAEAVESALTACGSITTHWDLRELPLPIADPQFHHAPMEHPNERVRSLVAQADASDAFVLASPVYHNSYAGVVKNALDHLTISQFYHKPVGLISHGGNRDMQAVDHLRIVMRGLLAIAIPTQVCTADQDYQILDTGTYELVSEQIWRRLDRFVMELLLLAYQLRTIR